MCVFNFLQRLQSICALTLCAGLFLFSGTADAENIQKPLNTWAGTQATVYAADYDNIVHVDINYNLDTLWDGIVADGTIDLGIYNSRAKVWEVTYFWVCLYRIDSPAGYVNGTEGEGNQFIGGYYWGVFAREDGQPVHCSLSVPQSYGTGNYRVEVRTRLGTWDYSYYDDWLQGPQFRVDRFQTALPTPSGSSIQNTGSDSIIEIAVPAYSSFPGYNPSFPPSLYTIEISADPAFPWEDGTHTPRATIYAYPEARNEQQTIYVSMDLLDHTKTTFYGRITSCGPNEQYWTPSDTASLGTVNVTYWTSRLPNVTNYSAANPGEDTTLSITVTAPQYSNFIAEAQSKNPKVVLFFAHESVSPTYLREPERLMTATQADKVYAVPIDMINGAGAVTVTPLMTFTDTGIYDYCARTTATGFTPGLFTNWNSIQVDHLGTAFPTIPAGKWAIDNTGSDPDIKVTVNPYNEFKGTSDPPPTYEVKVTKGSLTGYAYKDTVSGTTATDIYINLRSMTDGSGNPVDILSAGAGTVSLDIRCVGTARTAGAYSGVKNITVNNVTTVLPQVTNYSVTDPGEDTTLSITVTAPQYSNFTAEAQSKSPQVKVFLVHSPVYSIYQNDKEKLMTATQAQKVYAVPIDMVNGESPVTITPLMAFTDTGTYYYTARTTATGFTPGLFTNWNSIQVDHLGTAFPTIPAAKWSIDNDGKTPLVTVTVEPYDTFRGTADAPEVYELKISQGSLAGYAYQNTSTGNLPTDIYIDLRNIDDAAGNPVDLFSTSPSTVYFDIRCVGTARTAGAYSGNKPIALEALAVTPGSLIQDAIQNTQMGGTIYLTGGNYGENLYINGADIALIGSSSLNTSISGNILVTDSNFSIKDIAVLYQNGEKINYVNPHYTDFALVADGGITAVNSEIKVINCIIMPDPAVFGENKYGKGIQVWNLYDSADINPVIENNLILKADTGVFLFAQFYGGAVLGRINNNTFDLNNYAIIMRMHREEPGIYNNIVTRNEDAVHASYSSLLAERLAKVTNNAFGSDSFGNAHNFWCDELAAEKLLLPDAKGNISADPQYRDPAGLDYTPLNPACQYKGCRLGW